MTTTETWAGALEAFEDHLHARALALSTIDSYRRDLEHLRDALAAAAPNPWTVTTRQLQAYLGDRAWSRRTQLRVLVTLRAFYRFGIDTAACDRSPLIGLQTVTLKKSGPARQQPTPAWREPIASFQRHLAGAGRSPATVDMYGLRLQLLSYMLADPWAVTATDISDYLSRPDWSPSTKRGHQNTIRRFYRWAVKTGLTQTDPAADLDPVRVPRQLPRPAADDDLVGALSRADDRTRLALELGALAGLRISEVARLRWDQVGPASLLIQGKGGHWRQVPLHPDLAVSLNAARQRAETEAGHNVPPAHVFPSPAGGHLTPGHLGKLVRQAGADAFTPHALRHRFASQAYAATLDLRAVQELLGHSKPETTAVYAAVPDGALAAAVTGARLGHPRLNPARRTTGGPA